MNDTPENRRKLAAEIAGKPPAKQHSWHREPPKGLERMVADGDIPGVTTDKWKRWERELPADQPIDPPKPPKVQWKVPDMSGWYRFEWFLGGVMMAIFMILSIIFAY